MAAGYAGQSKEEVQNSPFVEKLAEADYEVPPKPLNHALRVFNENPYSSIRLHRHN